MNAWLDSGIEPASLERRSILSRLTLCSLTTNTSDGALRTRTAMIDQVAASGQAVLVRLLGSGLYDDVIRNPRVLLSAVQSLGPHKFIVLNGLARIHSRLPTDGERELLVLEITVQRMECWDVDSARAARKQAVGSRVIEPAARAQHEAIA